MVGEYAYTRLNRGNAKRMKVNYTYADLGQLNERISSHDHSLPQDALKIAIQEWLQQQVYWRKNTTGDMKFIGIQLNAKYFIEIVADVDIQVPVSVGEVMLKDCCITPRLRLRIVERIRSNE